MGESNRRVESRAWMRWRVTTMMAGAVYAALVLALIAQHRRHTEQQVTWATERRNAITLYTELDAEATKATIDYMAKRKMGFGQVTLAILEDPTRIERLEILRDGSPVPTKGVRLTGDKVFLDAARPTGEEVNKDFAARLVAMILDTNNYLYKGGLIYVYDLPSPQFGFRMRRGSGVLDLMFSLENTDPDGHVDLFVQTSTDRGEVLETHGRICMFQPRLAALLSRYSPE